MLEPPLSSQSGYSPYNGYEYWMYHSHFPTLNLLAPILEDVKWFLDTHRKEVVIIDFHEFPYGFSDEGAFLGLEKLVEEVLGKLYLRSFDAFH